MPAHPPIPSEEFDQAELLAAEKEAIGLFVSAHPLKPLREVLRAKVDCPLSALADRGDKDWVTVGGIIVEAKRIRTRNGDHMMFATLDDLGGAVELLVFGKALAEHEAALAVDEVVLVRGRVDHKEAGKTCLVAQSVERFAPSEQEIEEASRQADAAQRSAVAAATPVRLQVESASLSESVIEDIRHVIEDFPGPADVLIDVQMPSGESRRLRLGDAYRVQNTPTRARGARAGCRARTARRRLTAASAPAGGVLGRCSQTRSRAQRALCVPRGRARAASWPVRLPRARGLRGSRRASRARTAGAAAREQTGTQRSRRSPSSPLPMLA